MSKVFEDEYKQLAQDDFPDLWDRIEAGLSEKTVESAPAPKIKTVSFRKYAGLIAACLCAAVVIPAAVNIGKSNKSMEDTAYNSATTEAAGDMAAPASEEAAPVSEEAAADMGEMADMEEALTIEAEKAVEEAVAEESQAADDALKTDKTELAVNKQSGAESKKTLTDGTVIKDVALEITAVKEENGETVYSAIVQEDISGQLMQGEDITFTKGLYVEEELTTGQTYQVNLHYYGDEPYLFEVSKIVR